MRALALLAAAVLATGCAVIRPRPIATADGGGEAVAENEAGGDPSSSARPGRSAGEAGAESRGDLDPGLDRETDRDLAPDLDVDPDLDLDAPPSPEREPAATADATPDLSPAEAAARARILDAARRRLGTRPRLDCSGYVLDAYRAAGVPLPLPSLPPGRSRSESLFRAGREVARPRPGDLAFFHDTYDRNRDGKGGDRFTHVALVEDVDGDVVTLLHRGGRIERIRLDLAHPDDPARNDQIRFKRRGDVPGTRYLSGELLTAFGQLLDRSVTQTLQAGPAADTAAADPADHEPSHRSTVRASGTRGNDRGHAVRRGGDHSRGKVAAAPRVRRGAPHPRAAVPAPVADGDRPRADADR